jgi:hypothetical protein
MAGYLDLILGQSGSSGEGSVVVYPASPASSILKEMTLNSPFQRIEVDDGVFFFVQLVDLDGDEDLVGMATMWLPCGDHDFHQSTIPYHIPYHGVGLGPCSPGSG